MKVAIIKERRAHERRVAASPDTVKHMTGMRLDVLVESGAGAEAYFTDEAYRAAGATIVPDPAAALSEADIVLKVQRPLRGGPDGGDEVAMMKHGAVLIGLLQPLRYPADTSAYAEAGLAAFAMELMPRITRAQTMDVLSSQANLAGYKAALDAAVEFGRALPMMMTAAGTSGGYAREMDEDFQRRQREKITETLRRTDIVICTALIPGKQAPILLTEAMVAALAPGSVIVDLAVESGGNVEGSRAGEIVTTANGVKIVGHINMAARVPVDASQLYARNLLAFLALIVDKEGRLRIDTADESVKAALLTMDGAIVNPALMPEPAFAAAATS